MAELTWEERCEESRRNYLGETDVTDAYSTWTPTDFALLFMEMYGTIDGDHHKRWVIDQVTRILLGTPVIVKLAKWKTGESEPRFTTGEPSEKYLARVREWVESNRGEDGYEYPYDEGIAP
jgi:hypothetical protein